MARVTVEDSLAMVNNRFDLVLIAAKRARNISMGAEPMLPEDEDKTSSSDRDDSAESIVVKIIAVGQCVRQHQSIFRSCRLTQRRKKLQVQAGLLLQSSCKRTRHFKKNSTHDLTANK